MKALRISIIIGALLLWCSFFAEAQERSIGLRWAYGSGISYRQKLTEKHAVEGLLTARWGGVALTGLYQRERGISANRAWHWYYGGGLHMGLHRRSNERPPEFPLMARSHINVGIDLVVGTGYRFPQIPLELSLDLKPTISFTTQEGVPENFGLSLRYRL